MSKLKALLKDVPVEWKALRDVTKSIKTGLNPRSNFVLNTDNAKNYYVTVKEITSGKISFSSKTDRIDDSALEVIQNRSNLEIDDVLFSGIGTIGKVAIVDIPTMNWNCSESVFLIKPIKELTNPKYLMYLLDSPISKNQYEGLAVGSTLRGVRMDTLKKIQIPIPHPNNPEKSLEIQKEIVRVLDELTSLTNQLKTELETERQNRKKQFEFYREQLFSFEEGDAEWETLGDITQIITKGTTPKIFSSNGINFIKIESFNNNKIIPTKFMFISKEIHEKELKRSILKSNDILFAIAGATIGKCAIVSEEVLPANTNQALAIIRLNENINVIYIYP